MLSKMWFNAWRAAAIGSLALLTVYFSVLTLVSGRDFTWEQFREFWYFVVALTVGFGVQVGRRQIGRSLSSCVSGASGALASGCSDGV